MTSRLKRMRLKHGLTQPELAKRIGTSQQHYQRLETSDDELPLKWARAIAAALDENEEDLLEVRTVLIVGKVGAGARIFPFHDDHPDEDAPRAICPRKMNWKKTEALIVEGDSMYPEIDDGWVIFYDKTVRVVPPDVYGERCVVQLEDGARLLKRVTRGSAPGLYTLLSTNAAPIVDVKLSRATRAIALPPYLARVDNDEAA